MMKKARIALAALLFSAPCVADYPLYLHFADGSLEICVAASFSYDGSQIDVYGITMCEPDDIFKSGFE